MLTTDFGEPALAFLGFGGLFATVRALWKLPPIKDTDIVTVRNFQRRNRFKTKLVGSFAAVFFAISIGLYFYTTETLRSIGKVCEMDPFSHVAAAAIQPFFSAAIVALLFYAWLELRILRQKQ